MVIRAVNLPHNSNIKPNPSIIVKKISAALTKDFIYLNMHWQLFFVKTLLPGRSNKVNPVRSSKNGKSITQADIKYGKDKKPTTNNVSNGVKVLVCIPARFGSTRFRGKVLAKDTGKFLIQHVYEQACLAKLPDKVIIAADDERIAAAAESFGAECIMTARTCKSGTDRIAEAVQKLSPIPYPLSPNDIIVNLQADEPEIDPKSIDYVAKLLIETKNSKLKTQNYCMATLAAPFQNKEQIADPNIVKVITDCSNKAIYFSRAVIPYDREKSGIGNTKQYLRHLGIYAYRKDFLLKFTKLPQTPLEKIEKLEQLRAIENGFPILVGKVKSRFIGNGIDTPQQYADFVKRYKQKGKSYVKR